MLWTSYLDEASFIGVMGDIVEMRVESGHAIDLARPIGDCTRHGERAEATEQGQLAEGIVGTGGTRAALETIGVGPSTRS